MTFAVPCAIDAAVAEIDIWFVPVLLRPLLLLAASLLACPAAIAQDACPIERFPDISVTFIRNHPAVPVGINGIYVFFMLDTGASKTLVTPATQARFKLPFDARFHDKMLGTGGSVTAPYVAVGRFEFSGQTYINPTFPVLDINRSRQRNEPPDLFAGVIGGDFLRNYDVELDFAHDVMRLYRRPPCYPPHPNWDTPYQSIEVRLSALNVLIVPVIVNGNPLRAVFDTGAAGTVLRLAALSGARIDPESLRSDKTVGTLGAGGLQGKAWLHRVQTLDVGREHLASPLVWIEDFNLPVAEMLLGESYIQARKIWLAYSANLMFVELPPVR